jgi:hypothetical protein
VLIAQNVQQPFGQTHEEMGEGGSAGAAKGQATAGSNGRTTPILHAGARCRRYASTTLCQPDPLRPPAGWPKPLGSMMRRSGRLRRTCLWEGRPVVLGRFRVFKGPGSSRVPVTLHCTHMMRLGWGAASGWCWIAVRPRVCNVCACLGGWGGGVGGVLTICASAAFSRPAVAQHRQPPASGCTVTAPAAVLACPSAAAPWMTASSMPSAPNSLTTCNQRLARLMSMNVHGDQAR